MRALHQEAPEAAIRLTRSPSRTPVRRNSPSAALAAIDWPGLRWMSSKSSMKVRVGCASGPTLVETRGRLAGAGPAGASAGSVTPWKLAIVCGTPSSRTVKSPCPSPATPRPALSTTTTSTVTSSMPAGKAGLGGAGA